MGLASSCLLDDDRLGVKMGDGRIADGGRDCEHPVPMLSDCMHDKKMVNAHMN